MTIYCCFSGQNELILTPTSFIAIKAIRVVGDKYIDKCNNPSVASGQCNVASFDTLPSALICEIMQCAECKPVQFRCRVKRTYPVNFHVFQVDWTPLLDCSHMDDIVSSVNSCLLNLWVSSDLTVDFDRLWLFIFWCWRRIGKVKIPSQDFTPSHLWLIYLLLVSYWVCSIAMLSDIVMGQNYTGQLSF